MFVVGLILTAAGLYFIGKYLYQRHKNFKKLSPLQSGHLRKEKEMLKFLLDDIQENTNDWFLSHDHAIAGGLCLVNDRKNIGLVYRHTDISQLIIYMNLRSLMNFSLTEADTAVLHINGPHVKRFITHAEETIDKRGNELEFFKGEIEKRL